MGVLHSPRPTGDEIGMADTGQSFITEVVSDRPGGSTLGTLAEFRAHGVRCRTSRPKVTVNPQYVRRLALNQRDREIVNYLSEVGFGTSTQLERLFFSNLAHPHEQACRRLLSLWQWSVLDRTLSNGMEFYGISRQLVYSPGPAGLLMLSGDDPEGKKKKLREAKLLQHNVLLGEAVTGIVETARKQSWACTFYGEHGTYTKFQYDGKWIKMRPDGLLYFRHPEGAAELAMFLEMDTGSRVLETYTAKVYQYELYLRSKAWASNSSVFPAVGVIVWASDPAGVTPEAQAHRVKLAEGRLQRVISWVRARRSRALTDLRWFFARLDQAQADNWRLLTDKGEVREVHLLSAFSQRQELAQNNA